MHFGDPSYAPYRHPTRDRSLRGTRRAFSLIELLVVVAIIAMLVAILLPNLARAREQARIVKCLAGLAEIGKAMSYYFEENNNWFPFEKRNWPTDPDRGLATHGYYYGGHPGRPGWFGYDNPRWRDTPRGRPFNRYLYPDLPETEPGPPRSALFEDLRNKMTIFVCPSDVGGFYQSETGDNAVGSPGLYYDVGSSYTVNWQFVDMWAGRANADQRSKDRVLQRANRFLRIQAEKNVGRFAVMYEDPFDSAIFNNIGRRGWHKQWNKHTMLFLDAHAAYPYTNTARGNFGPDWKASTNFWWANVDDPDYPYRNLTAP